jgi:hypothetical protein
VVSAVFGEDGSRQVFAQIVAEELSFPYGAF